MNSRFGMKELAFIKIFVIFREFVTCFQQISEDKNCRAVVISGSGKTFSAGKKVSVSASNKTILQIMLKGSWSNQERNYLFSWRRGR